jgi:hypothetical protein
MIGTNFLAVFSSPWFVSQEPYTDMVHSSKIRINYTLLKISKTWKPKIKMKMILKK